MEPNREPSVPASGEALQAELDAVRVQLRWTQFFSFGLGVTLALLVFRLDQFQVRSVENHGPTTLRLLQDLERMNTAVHELQKFAATHPDYLPILQKYGVDLGTNLSVRPVPAGVKLPAAAPAAPAAPPKK